MSSWDEVRKKYPNFKGLLWQGTSGNKCVKCGIEDFDLRIVEGYPIEFKICRMCYTFLEDEEDTDDSLWEEGKEYHIDDLPPEVIPPDSKGSKITDW